MKQMITTSNKINLSIRLIVVLVLLLACFTRAHAEEQDKKEFRIKPHILYRDDNRTYNYDFLPITYYMNLSFDTAQVPKEFTQDEYLRKHAILFSQVSHPIRTINRAGGFRKALVNELYGIPALPNWSLHLIGGAYDFRMMAEWFDSRGFIFPYFFAFVTAYAAHMGNEAIEETPKRLYATDHVADFYFFDFFACFFFLNDRVVRFFYNELQFRAWYGQPMLDLKNMHINNASASYIFRPFLFGKTIRPFIMMGMHYLGGLSINTTGNDYLSVSAGLAVRFPARQGTKFADNFKRIRPAVGIYYDRNDSLLCSLILNGTQNYIARLNVYPPAFKIQNLDIGLFLAVDNKGRPAWGLNINLPFGIGWHI